MRAWADLGASGESGRPRKNWQNLRESERVWEHLGEPENLGEPGRVWGHLGESWGIWESLRELPHYARYARATARARAGEELRKSWGRAGRELGKSCARAGKRAGKELGKDTKPVILLEVSQKPVVA